MLPHTLMLDYEKINTLTPELWEVENLATFQAIRKLGHCVLTETGSQKKINASLFPKLQMLTVHGDITQTSKGLRRD